MTVILLPPERFPGGPLPRCLWRDPPPPTWFWLVCLCTLRASLLCPSLPLPLLQPGPLLLLQGTPPSTPASCPALLPPAGIEPLPAHIRPPPDQMLRGQRLRVVWSLPRLRRSEGRGGRRRRASSPAHPSWLALPSAPPCPSSQAPSHVYSGHSSHVTNVDFLCDDSHLISTGGKDTSIMQWRVI